MDGDQNAIEATPDLDGEDYLVVLQRLHAGLKPRTYLEIGTSVGNSLRLASCAAVAIDPAFQLTQDVVGTKPLCALYQMPSDRYFAQHDPKAVLGGPVEMAFLDGLHRCEFLLRDFINTERHCRKNAVVMLHDCVPVETTIAERVDEGRAAYAHRRSWWLGDVWRTLLALKRRRPDLRITVLDAAPSGLACVTNLDPRSTALADDYAAIVEEMLSWSLREIGLRPFREMIDLESTSCLDTHEKITRRFWL
jgi:hypothetical protein